MGKEAEIESKLVRLATAHGIYTRKFSSPGNRSVPDRIFIAHGGRVMFIEVKAPGEKPTDAQQDEIDRITMVGGLATWADTYEVGKGLLFGLLEDDHRTMSVKCRARNFWQP